MEDKGILDNDNPVHLWVLHFVFLPRINHALDAFTTTWNNHKLSSQRNKTPQELFLRGTFPLSYAKFSADDIVAGLIEAKERGFHLNLYPGNPLDDGEEAVQRHAPDFTLYGAEFKGAQRERRPSDPHVMFEPPQAPFPLTQYQLEFLYQAVADIDENEDFLGTVKYLRVLALLGNIVSSA